MFQGQSLSEDAKRLISHVFLEIKKEDASHNHKKRLSARERAAKYLGIGIRTVDRYKNYLIDDKDEEEGKTEGKDMTIRKTYLNQQLKSAAYHSVIALLSSRMVQGMRTSSNVIHKYLSETLGIPYFTNPRQTRRFLVELGFRYTKADNYKCLKQAPHIQEQLKRFLTRFAENRSVQT